MHQKKSHPQESLQRYPKGEMRVDPFEIQSMLHLRTGSKAAPRTGGIGSAAAGQATTDGESVLSKILPGGAAEQAGKLGDGITPPAA